MIRYEVGNLLSVTKGIIVHGCNLQGVMGAGVAAAIKEMYPECFDRYAEGLDGFLARHVEGISPQFTTQEEIDNYALRMRGPAHGLGSVIWWDNKEKLIIANAITQRGFSTKRDTDYNAIDSVFERVFERAADLYLTEIHIPLIGSGIGGGSWAVIESIILDRAANCNYRPGTVDVVVHCLSEDDIPFWRI